MVVEAEAEGEVGKNCMETKRTLTVWQGILLGVLVVGFIGVLVNFLFLSNNGSAILQLPGMNTVSEQMDQEYISEPTPVPGT